MRNEKSFKKDEALVRGVKAIVVGDIIGTLICIALTVIASFLFVKSKHIPQAMLTPLTIAIAAIGAFIGSYVTVRISKINGMLYGMASGFILFVILFISSLIIAREPLTMMTAIKAILLVLVGAIGGIIGVNKRSK